MASLIIQASLDALTEVLSFVDEQLEMAECSMKAQMQIDIALEEMYVNVAHYAYAGQDSPGNCEIMTEMLTGEKKGICITLKDQGIPFNPLEKKDPDITLSAEERQVGGLGIFMVKKSMDEVAYEYKDGSNSFRMTKYW